MSWGKLFILHSLVRQWMQIDSVIDKLTIYYTNADNLLNKRNELQLIVASKQPDVLVITEIFPKKYWINQNFTGRAEFRRVLLLCKQS